jgi:hypothetical protein
MKNPLVHLAVALLSLAFCLNIAHGQTRARAPQGSETTVVFAVTKYQEADGATGDGMIDPIVVINRGRFTAPPEGPPSEGGETTPEIAAGRRFVADFYRPNRKYRVLSGGGESGTASVIKYVEPGCVGNEASVALQTGVKLGGQVLALATNSSTLGRGEGTRRAPTEQERAAALKLAQSTLGQKGVKASLIAKMETVNLTAADLNGDGKAELIGAFIIKGAIGAEYALLMVFEPAGAGFRAAMTWYVHTTGEAEVQYRRLVDVLDLDGDGVAEILVQGLYYESHNYMIYKKAAGQWRVVYEGGGGGC